jgi:NAD(P)-dependent dehydrogenase (short-subunit alcohol dehydrogenase family)
VVLVDIDDAKLAAGRESLSSAIAGAIESILVVRADVTSEDDVQEFVAQTIKHFGKLDSAFLCAGLSYEATSVLKTSVEQYDKVMQVNCRSGE